jgi:hypothetical protein
VTGFLSGTRLVLGLMVALGPGLGFLLLSASTSRRPTITGPLGIPDEPIQPEIELTEQSPDTERLRALWHMHQRGLVDDAEYERLRSALLEGEDPA